MMTQGERIASLEVVVAAQTREISELKELVQELVALKNRGAGAFWLASALFGVSIVSAASYVWSIFK